MCHQEERIGRAKQTEEELLALADTIKALNDDDALKLFKKTIVQNFHVLS